MIKERDGRDDRAGVNDNAYEAERLLLDDHDHDHDSDSDVRPTPSRSPPSPIRPPPRRQSSFAQPRPNGTPRTAQRVRFDFEEPSPGMTPGSGRPDPPWLEDDDFLSSPTSVRRSSESSQRAPLLTDIEAPSVTLATDEFNPEEYLENARPKSNIRSAFMNMANSIIGAGIIGQPYALRQSGLLTGLMLLIGLTLTVDWTIRLIVVNSKLSGANSFQATVEHCFGRSGLIAISLAQWAFAFGGMVAFCVIVGDTLPHVIAAMFPSIEHKAFLWLFTNRRAVIVIFILGISYPLSLYRDIAKLAKASTLALISMIVILITVIIQGPQVPSDLRGPLRGSLLVNNGIFQAIGVISFAFVCHHNSLLIYGSLRKPTLDRFATVTHWSTGVSCLACIAMALAGYLSFGDKTQGNILNNFPTNNIMVNIARLCFGLNMLTTLPLEAFVCREVMVNYWFSDEPFEPTRHLIFTTSLVVSAMTLSLFTCDLGTVFELIGATSACALAYIFPPLCYIKLSSKKREKIPAYICVAFGFGVMIISTLLAVHKMVNNEGGVHQC